MKSLPLEIIYEVCDKIEYAYDKIKLLKILNCNIPKKIWKEYFSDILSGIFMTCFVCKRHFIQQEVHAGYDECSSCYYGYDFLYESSD